LVVVLAGEKVELSVVEKVAAKAVAKVAPKVGSSAALSAEWKVEHLVGSWVET
jgi:hypothetical protein